MTEPRRIWLRALLFSALAAPLLGGLLAGVAAMAVRSWPPPSIPMVLAIAVSVSYIVATGPALLAGLLCTFLALRWQREGYLRSRIAFRLACVGIALGAATALLGGSLGEGRPVASWEHLGPGALTGLLVGLAFPRVLWPRVVA